MEGCCSSKNLATLCSCSPSLSDRMLASMLWWRALWCVLMGLLYLWALCLAALLDKASGSLSVISLCLDEKVFSAASKGTSWLQASEACLLAAGKPVTLAYCRLARLPLPWVIRLPWLFLVTSLVPIAEVVFGNGVMDRAGSSRSFLCKMGRPWI